MTREVIYQGENKTVYFYPAEENFLMETPEGFIHFEHDEMVKFVSAIGEKILEIHHEELPLMVGDHVKVLGNAPDTAWETGCIEHIDGCMAYLVYGVKTLGEFGGIRGMGMPVPLSMLKRI